MVPAYFECGTCGKGFKTGHDGGRNSRYNHCLSTGHVAPEFECDTCPQHFESEAARLRHMDTERHHDCNDMDLECDLCNRIFQTEEDRSDHEIVDHFHCGDCQRTFKTHDAVKMHLQSNLHKDHIARCPLCDKTGDNVEAIAKHLETGLCPNAPGTNRDKMHELVRSKDPVNRISHQSVFEDRTAVASITYVANEAAWNGKGYACCFCNSAFNDLPTLNSHLNSDIHDETLYHCPDAGCNATFRSLTATIAHLESGRHGASPATLEKFLWNVFSG